MLGKQGVLGPHVPPASSPRGEAVSVSPTAPKQLPPQPHPEAFNYTARRHLRHLLKKHLQCTLPNPPAPPFIFTLHPTQKNAGNASPSVAMAMSTRHQDKAESSSRSSEDTVTRGDIQCIFLFWSSREICRGFLAQGPPFPLEELVAVR